MDTPFLISIVFTATLADLLIYSIVILKLTNTQDQSEFPLYSHSLPYLLTTFFNYSPAIVSIIPLYSERL